MYVAAICCLNFLMATFGTPMVVLSCFNKVWLFGQSGCSYYGFLISFGGLASMLLLTMISVDRYIYIVKHNLSKHLSTSPIIICTTVCCFITIGFTISPLIGWNQYTYEGVGTACAIDLVGEHNNGKSYVLALFSVYFAFPLSVMIFAYGSIYAKVVRDSKAQLKYNGNDGSVETRSQFRKKLTNEQELAITVTMIIGFFLISYTPYTCVLLWKVLSMDGEINPIAMAIPAMITKIAGIFTPFVYLSRSKVFRKHLLNLYPCLRSKKKVHAARGIEQRDVISVNLKGETTRVYTSNTIEGNGSKQHADRNCPSIKHEISINDENVPNMISNIHSTVAVFTVAKSDIYKK
ncbi:OPN4 [Mytilus coruscus]|uniref:OPN4 n=1 Tax=Mytilus coruscus TaxID=42192 RepID=A0A6J8C0K2_MYTCO|nr:OPN4 [Mytilus coruscus]